MDELVPLSDANLGRLAGSVSVPAYDRRAITAGIVHIGLGNFHRAHQAWYLHRLFQQGLCLEWGIIGAGVRPNDALQREKLLAQDCLTTLIELDPAGKSAEVCGSIIGYVPVMAGNAALIEKMADPAIRIVSLTVTEGGYYTDPASGKLDTRHPDILHDAENPGTPMTVFGAMIAALKQRRENGSGPFTGLSCDNLQGNGRILENAVVSLAGMSDPGLADWIRTECSYPNSMVDCIVPATGPREIALANAFGIDDLAPVTHEKFRQWVIEDDFCAGRPDWDKVGATFSDRVHDFETMKLRILNGGHQIIADAGELLSIDTISRTMAHDAIRGLFRKVAVEEIVSHVAPVPGYQPIDYLELIERRFSNPEIADTTRRVAFDGSSRQPSFIVPSIADGLKAGSPVEGLALVSALWARYCMGTREDGSVIEPNDPHWSELNAAALAARNKPEKWVQMPKYYGTLANHARFTHAFEKWLRRIVEDGVEATIRSYLGS